MRRHARLVRAGDERGAAELHESLGERVRASRPAHRGRIL
jgi:hypothetical protein